MIRFSYLEERSHGGGSKLLTFRPESRSEGLKLLGGYQLVQLFVLVRKVVNRVVLRYLFGARLVELYCSIIRLRLQCRGYRGR